MSGFAQNVSDEPPLPGNEQQLESPDSVQSAFLVHSRTVCVPEQLLPRFVGHAASEVQADVTVPFVQFGGVPPVSGNVAQQTGLELPQCAGDKHAKAAPPSPSEPELLPMPESLPLLEPLLLPEPLAPPPLPELLSLPLPELELLTWPPPASDASPLPDDPLPDPEPRLLFAEPPVEGPLQAATRASPMIDDVTWMRICARECSTHSRWPAALRDAIHRQPRRAMPPSRSLAIAATHLGRVVQGRQRKGGMLRLLCASGGVGTCMSRWSARDRDRRVAQASRSGLREGQRPHAAGRRRRKSPRRADGHASCSWWHHMTLRSLVCAAIAVMTLGCAASSSNDGGGLETTVGDDGGGDSGSGTPTGSLGAGDSSSPDCAPGSKTFSTPGASSFTVPNFDTLTVQVWGGGGGGGACGEAAAPTAGDQSSFDGSLIAGGGAGGNQMTGGTASGGTTNTPGGNGGPPAGYPNIGGQAAGGTCPSGGSGGSGVVQVLDACHGGDGNSGHAPGGGGASSWMCQGQWQIGDGWGCSAGGGGAGAYTSKSYSIGQLTPGTTIAVVVGAGGQGSKGSVTSGGGGTGKNPGYYTGGDGAPGQVSVAWTCNTDGGGPPGPVK